MIISIDLRFCLVAVVGTVCCALSGTCLKENETARQKVNVLEGITMNANQAKALDVYLHKLNVGPGRNKIVARLWANNREGIPFQVYIQGGWSPVESIYHCAHKDGTIGVTHDLPFFSPKVRLPFKR